MAVPSILNPHAIQERVALRAFFDTHASHERIALRFSTIDLPQEATETDHL